ncbi:MAG: HyaD/HybD family hydrogenase maturation endopeptidase [Thioalkalispiraceae bacterium]|jgi:hydrogenase maturation protease
MKTLVLGVGNTLLTDEGVGVHVIRHLQTNHPDQKNTTYLDGGTLSFTLAGDIEDSDQLIVIDATQLHSEPGTVQQFVDEAMDDFLCNKRHMSVHEVGLLDLLNISRLANRLPKRRALIGIQPKTLDWGDQPSAEVAAAIPLASRKTIDLISEWQL